MTFYFGEKEGDELMQKINLRDLSSRAKQWDHPVKGLLKYTEAIAKHGKDILKIPKKDRERYCVSLVGMALKNDFGLDWWTHMPNQDPPDGMIMTLKEEQRGVKTGYMAFAREIEVVEHRNEPEKIFDVIRDKMVEYAYESNTILVCLILSPAIYDLQKLAILLGTVTSSINHVFVVFAGVALTQNLPTPQELQTTFTMVQLLPVYQQTTLDILPHLDDFKERYENGRESRLIEANGVYYGTSNPKFTKNF